MAGKLAVAMATMVVVVMLPLQDRSDGLVTRHPELCTSDKRFPCHRAVALADLLLADRHFLFRTRPWPWSSSWSVLLGSLRRANRRSWLARLETRDEKGVVGSPRFWPAGQGIRSRERFHGYPAGTATVACEVRWRLEDGTTRRARVERREHRSAVGPGEPFY
ncbi:hypothetical protein KM043_009482 [Ampulex compressa]|nr:hypothetical protein KM043_009482 [Ampulex compressa]